MKKIAAKRNDGFTLIELLLALAIFSIIALATIKELRQVQATKEIAFQNTRYFNGFRTAFSIMESDLNQAFHVQFTDIGKDNYDKLKENVPAARTLFDGRKKELIFTSVSRRVYYSGTRESEQTEISYFLEKKPDSQHQTLMKREAPFIDEDLYEGGEIITLLEDIISLEFQYWDKKTEKWIDDWNTDGGDKRDQFPETVKVTISLATPGKPMEVEGLFKLSFPNNQKYVAEY